MYHVLLFPAYHKAQKPFPLLIFLSVIWSIHMFWSFIQGLVLSEATTKSSVSALTTLLVGIQISNQNVKRALTAK